MLLLWLAYALVAVGVLLGRLDAGDGRWRAVWVAAVWPVYALVGVGRAIA